MNRSPSVTMADEEGRQYHIGLRKGELAERLILCGDPDRLDLARDLFDKVELETRRREFRSITGTVAGRRMSVISTGIGPDNTEIAVVESSLILEGPIFVRAGSCGALQEQIKPGDLVISTGAVAFENTSTFYVPECFPAVADHEVVRRLIDACSTLGLKHHVGLTATTPGFYGSQMRSLGKFKPLPNLSIQDLRRLNVLNFEMEASCLFRLATISGAKAGAICVAFTNRVTDEVIGEDEKQRAEENCMKAAMAALAEM